ncbi:N5-glutamine methyltransferase family protein [Kytococcus sp. Marseille-QA3725]
MSQGPAGDSLDSLLRSTTARLGEAGCPSPAADAATLLAHVLECDGSELHRQVLLGRGLSGDDPRRSRLEELVGRRVAREPLQHLTGVAWFAGVPLEVGPGVFVPRPETELLVTRALELLECPGRDPQQEVEVVDLCAGSGAVVLGIGCGVERLRQQGEDAPAPVLRAVEMDPVAAEYAQRNIEQLGLTVDLRVSDARFEFDDREGQVDLAVSNPPYVPDGALPVDPEVLEHDPAAALYGGSPDGLALPLALTRRATGLLRPGGHLLMEHDDSQGESMPRMLTELGFTDVRDHLDLAGRPRFVEGRWPGR